MAFSFAIFELFPEKWNGGKNRNVSVPLEGESLRRALKG